MNCPSCGGALDADMVEGQPTATCQSCSGVWLSAGRLDAIAGASLEQKLREEWAHEPDSCRYCQSALGFGSECPTCGRAPTIQCPSGHGVMNTAWVELAGIEVEVDQCPSCGGLWLDAHEREALQGNQQHQRQNRRKPEPVRIDGFLPAPARSRALPTAEPQREIDKFLSVAHVGAIRGASMPTRSVAWVMVIVAAALFVVFRYFAWPYISGMLN